ncbi:Putative cyclic-di-GMP phosphodiesterase YlaB [Pandoraea captiosa]|uniref:cyclic-guanylate-specific phosphodiesterase n=1 Tax=Pandoraea captiosa TaxID=2508302 RepID=A0A5E4ZHP8_9BURK|nr:EAL domain-containing protein [Pandoraea captiosa]VVE60187.1 Putative cyclic-di-GMP phosphodiesterase YlaB [Pandoraea captiosa]
MQTLRRLTRWLPVLIGAIAGMLVMLFIGQIAQTRVDDFRLRAYVQDIMGFMGDASLSSRSALHDAMYSGAVPCTDADILALRRVAMRSPYFHDIARVHDSRLLCSAVVGRFDPEPALPPPSHETRTGVKLWHTITGIVTPGVQVNAIGLGDVVVFSPPVLPARLSMPGAGFASVASTSDMRFQFWRAGKFEDQQRIMLGKTSRWLDIGPLRQFALCSDSVDVCASAIYTSSRILTNPWGLFMALSIGAVVGGAVGQSWRSRRRYRMSIDWVTQQAAESGGIHLVYQPLVRLRDGKMIGVEALARLNDSAGNPISPDIFIPIAERRGVIGLITRQVARKALVEMHARVLADPEFHVSINLAATDVVDQTFHTYLNHIAASLRVPRAQIALEVTERSTDNMTRLREALDRLRVDGYQIHIDDFGTGFSNLAYLSTLNVDALKIDRMFTQAIGKDTVGSAIVDQICKMATLLHVDVIVEGLETQAQADYMLTIHPDAIGQGWLFGKAVAAEDLMPGVDVARGDAATAAAHAQG